MNNYSTSITKTALYYLLTLMLSIISIKPKSKTPVCEWKPYQSKLMTKEECEKQFNAGNNIAVVCGKVSGVIVIDLDKKELLEQLFPDGLPHTPIVETAQGYHLYFKYEAGISNYHNFGGTIGLDIKSDGGYVVAPPSVHPSGFIYTWLEGHCIGEVPFASLPKWVKEKIQFEKTPYEELEKGGFSEGGRQSALVRLLGIWFKEVMILAIEPILEKAMAWNLTNKPPLPQDEVIASTNSIFHREQKKRQEVETVAWGTPVDLPMKLPPVPELTPQMIPKGLRTWIVDAAERMQVRIDGIAVSAIVAAGSLIGRACGVFPKKFDDWLVVANIWGGFINPPGQKKSPTIAEGQFALSILADDSQKDFKQELEKHEVEVFMHKTKVEHKKNLLKKQITQGYSPDSSELLAGELIKPVQRRYYTQDGTIEKIGELLQENPNGILNARDELIGWLQSLEKAGREGDRAFYLEGWNGTGSYTFDRIGRGTVTIPGMCLSVFGGITPSRLQEYVYEVTRNRAGNDGLLQRFQLTVWPDPLKEYVHIDRVPNKAAVDSALEIFKWLASIQHLEWLNLKCKNNIPGLNMSAAAQKLFDTWITNLELRLRGDELEGTPLESHLAKYRSLMPSLALIFHLIEMADSNPLGEPGAVSAQAVQMAIDWCVYLESHANRVYSLNEQPEMLSASVLLDHIRKGDVKDGCTPRDIYRNGWKFLKTPDETKAALLVLDEYGWVHFQKGQNGHGSVSIHPDLK